VRVVGTDLWDALFLFTGLLAGHSFMAVAPSGQEQPFAPDRVADGRADLNSPERCRRIEPEG
jgi:hypothetical protein